MSENLDLIKEIQQLRVSGEFQEAFILMSDLLKGSDISCAELIETLRLSILVGKNQMAYDIYLTVKGFKDFNPQEIIEILLRLKLSLRNEPILELDTIDAQNSPSWCQQYFQYKQDPIYDSKICDCSIDCFDGTINYTFSCLCLSCNQSYAFQISRSLMVYREFYCPSCLARQFIDFSLIKDYLTKSFKGGPIEKAEDYNTYLSEMATNLNFDSVEDNHFPVLCQYLNTDYTFYLIQLILKRQLNFGEVN